MRGSILRGAAVAAAASLSALVATIGAASSAGAADTTTTFELTAPGGLSISAPGSASLGSFAANTATVSGSLGDVTVSDGRAALVANWTASVSATDFTTGTFTGPETVTKENVTYLAGLPTSSQGTGVFAPGVSGVLGLSLPAFTYVGSGVNSVTWNPQLTIAVAPGKVAGTYTGTITHSVS